MPPPILDDSEIEDDDVVYDESRDSLSRSSGESAPGIPALGGTRDTLNQSTGSTERLKRQIDDAQRNLCGDSSGHHQTKKGTSAQADIVSPTLIRDKRRHSVGRHQEPVMSPVKRAHSTYSIKKAPASSIERKQREDFHKLFGQDTTAPVTSPSVRFSDHSGIGGSSGLPVGSMQAEFVHHEPAMFKESGSTIPDNESSHERMVEQALRSKSLKATSSPGMKLLDSDEMAKSSSFPWSASEQTPATKSHLAGDEQIAMERLDLESKLNDHQSRVPELEEEQTVVPAPTENHQVGPAPATAVMVAPSTNNELHRSSPTVHIELAETKAPSITEQDAVPVEKPQKASRGRKRKVQEESSEPLNSDDIAVGLPKERYKPRPSRRRATDVVEEPIDYSVVPEKAARSKRSKTVGGSTKSAGKEYNSTERGASPVTTSSAKQMEQEDTKVPDGTVASKSFLDDARSQMPAKASKSSPVVEVPARIDPRPSQLDQATSQHVEGPASQIKEEAAKMAQAVFAKPAPKRQSASKSKRSSTTIFEDHVDFTGKSKSPSLSQQQATRQSALRDVKNEASPIKRKRNGKAVIPDDDDDDEDDEDDGADAPPRTRRPRKHVVPDDDQDELAFDPSTHDRKADELPDAEPKKRGRGRPAKSSKAEKAKPAKASKEEKEDQESADENAQPVQEEPQKKRRGRPAKPTASLPVVDDTKDADDVDVDNEAGSRDGKVGAKNSIETTAHDSTPAKSNSAAVIPTPSPEKQPSHETKAAQEKLPKASPTAHSPIKSSSPAPYRVGLSKKHRIPSLLRVMRPPPKR